PGRKTRRTCMWSGGCGSIPGQGPSPCPQRNTLRQRIQHEDPCNFYPRPDRRTFSADSSATGTTLCSTLGAHSHQCGTCATPFTLSGMDGKFITNRFLTEPRGTVTVAT